jgi:hypothetical protein
LYGTTERFQREWFIADDTGSVAAKQFSATFFTPCIGNVEKWKCKAICKVQVIDTFASCPDRVSGTASGSSAA